MSSKVLVRALTLVVGLTMVSVWGASAEADESARTAPISLRLSPAVLEIAEEDDGGPYEFRVENSGSEALHVTTELAEFTVTPDGTTQFAGPDEISAASWVEVDTPEFDLEPGERRDVAVTIDVPDDAAPGERYVSVIFAVPATGGDGNISVTHRVAAKLYIDVPGAQISRLELGELTGPGFFGGGRARFELTVHNRGNVHQSFEGDAWLIATSGSAEIPFQNFTVLAGSSRVVQAVWAEPPTLCWCDVEVAIDDGQGNVLTASTRVILFPWRLTLAALTVTVGLAMLLVAGRRRHAERLRRQLVHARHEGAAAVGYGPVATPERVATPGASRSAVRPTAVTSPAATGSQILFAAHGAADVPAKGWRRRGR